GSLLAFRAPDVRGVIAYSSLAQIGFITLRVFPGKELRPHAARPEIVQPRPDHGLVVPARRRDRAARDDRRVLAAGWLRARAADPGDRTDDDGHHRPCGCT